jgi:hypothetical protein
MATCLKAMRESGAVDERRNALLLWTWVCEGAVLSPCVCCRARREPGPGATLQVTKGLAMRGHRQQAVMMGGLVEQLADRACGMRARVKG